MLTGVIQVNYVYIKRRQHGLFLPLPKSTYNDVMLGDSIPMQNCITLTAKCQQSELPSPSQEGYSAPHPSNQYSLSLQTLFLQSLVTMVYGRTWHSASAHRAEKVLKSLRIPLLQWGRRESQDRNFIPEYMFPASRKKTTLA